MSVAGQGSDQPSPRAGGGRGARGKPDRARVASAALRDPRRVAFDVTRAVERRDAYANLLLPATLRERGLTGRDAALATELTYGTLRGRGSYDAILAACVDRPLAKVEDRVLGVLRLGAHQLLGMSVAAHAAVATSVDLAQTVSGARTTGFVNAVLRRVAEHDLAGWVAIVAPDAAADGHGYLSVAHSHPRWIVEAFAAALQSWGRDAVAELPLLLASDNEPPAVTLVARPGLCDIDELLAAGARRGRNSSLAAVLEGGDPGLLAAVASGRAGVQDEGSQLVAMALAAVPPTAASDERWLDVCAGPGGKAALLAALAAQSAARVLACDVMPHRTALIARAFGPAPGGPAVITADATRPAWRAASFDRALADVPCTGLGALRRRPEARWRRDPTALASLQPLQVSLLSNAVDSVRPGGVIAYSTCSPHVVETLQVIAQLLVGRDDVQAIDARDFLPGVADLGPGPFVQLWPHVHGTDAMFLALLRRR